MKCGVCNLNAMKVMKMNEKKGTETESDKKRKNRGTVPSDPIFDFRQMQQNAECVGADRHRQRHINKQASMQHTYPFSLSITLTVLCFLRRSAFLSSPFPFSSALGVSVHFSSL